MRNASEILQPLTGKLGERGAHFLNHTSSDQRFHCLVEVWRVGGNRPWVKPPRFVQFLLKFGSPVSVSSFSVLPWGNFQRLSMAGFNHFINSSFKRAQVSAAKDVFSSCSNDRSPPFRFRCQSSAFHLFRLSPRSLKDSCPGLLALKQRLLPQGCGAAATSPWPPGALLSSRLPRLPHSSGVACSVSNALSSPPGLGALTTHLACLLYPRLLTLCFL